MAVSQFADGTNPARISAIAERPLIRPHSGRTIEPIVHGYRLVRSSSPGPDRAIAAGTAGGSNVDAYVVADMGHAWPGAKSGPLAAPDAPIVATDILWDFFVGHPRRR